MGNCFKRIPENLEAVYLVFRMFLENVCLNVKKMPLSPRIYGLSGNSLSNLIFHHFPVILSALKRFCISVFLTRLVRGILCGCFCDSGEGLGSAGCNLWIGETDCRIIELFERPLFGKCGAYGLPADKNRAYILPLIRPCGVSASEKSANTSKRKIAAAIIIIDSIIRSPSFLLYLADISEA